MVQRKGNGLKVTKTGKGLRLPGQYGNGQLGGFLPILIPALASVATAVINAVANRKRGNGKRKAKRTTRK